MAAKTLQTIQLEVGRKCRLTDSLGNFKDGNVTATDITAFANQRQGELYLEVVKRFPYLGETIEYLDLEDGVNFYSFAGLTNEKVLISYVGIKYSSTDEDYTKCIYKQHNVLFSQNTDDDNALQAHPVYMFSKDPTTGTDGIEIHPMLESGSAHITDGIMIKYVILPDDLADSTDTMSMIPTLAHGVVVQYVIADVWEAKGDWSNSNQAMNRAMMLEDKFFKGFDPYGSDVPVRASIGKSFNPFVR